MNDEQIKELQNELQSWKIKAEQGVKDEAGLRHEIDDLKRKVDAYRSARDVQERHHKMYRAQYQERRDQAIEAQQILMDAAKQLKGEKPDVAGALKTLETAFGALKPKHGRG